jgi:hypothetical protein
MSPSATLAPLVPMLSRVQLTVCPLTAQLQPAGAPMGAWMAKLAGTVSLSVTPVGAVPLKLGLSVKLKRCPTSSWPPSWLLASAST